MRTPPSFNNPFISLLGIVINAAMIPIAPMITGKKNEGKIGIFKKFPHQLINRKLMIHINTYTF